MKYRYRLWYCIIFLLHFGACYITMMFCSIHKNSSKAWLQGSLISLVLDLFIFQIVKTLIKGILRQLVKLYPAKWIIWLYAKYEEFLEFSGC